MPIHRADDFQVIIKAARNGYDSNRDERGLLLCDCAYEDEELAEKAGRERQTSERRHRHQHRECKKGRAFGQAIKTGNFFAGLLCDNNQDGKAQKRHEQISHEIKSNSAAIEACDADQQVTRMRDAGVAEQTFEIVLRERGEIAVNDSEQRDQHDKTLHVRQHQKRLEHT